MNTGIRDDDILQICCMTVWNENTMKGISIAKTSHITSPSETDHLNLSHREPSFETSLSSQYIGKRLEVEMRLTDITPLNRVIQ